MQQLIDFLRKVGLLHVSKGEYDTGEFDDRKDLQEEAGTHATAATVHAQQNAGSVGRKIFFVITVLIALMMLLGAFGVGDAIVTVIIWGVTLYLLWRWAFRGQLTTVLIIIVFVIACILSLIAVPSGDFAVDDSAQMQQNAAAVAEYDGKQFTVTSEDGTIQGTVGVRVEGGSFPLTAQYNLHITDTYAVNKKCYEGPGYTDKNCRWIDYYNYGGGLFNEGGIVTSSQLYPVFCDGFASITDPLKGLQGEYVKCWYGKGNTLQETKTFYWGTTRSFENVENFLASNQLRIYDAQKHTVRTFVLEDGVGTSTESMNVQDAIDGGQLVREYTLIFEE